MDLQFNVELATQYGLDESVFLNSIYFWIRKNAANQKNRKDGRYWTYNTRTALATLFPFWSPRQIDRITKSCVDQGLLLVAHPSGMNRTTWYALTERAEKLFGMTMKNEVPSSPNGDTVTCDAFHQTVKSNTPNGDSVSPNGEMYIKYSKGTNKDQKRNATSTSSSNDDVETLAVEIFKNACGGDPVVMDWVVKFLNMRKEKGKKYKTTNGPTATANKLRRYSNDNPTVMALILENSVSNEWLTVYPPRDDDLKRIQTTKSTADSGVVDTGGMRVL